jgi:hypothetical protein
MDNPRRVQCGDPECKRQHVNARQREFQQRYKAEHGNYHSRQYDRGKKRQRAITCQQCGSDATVTKATARYCSHACFYDAQYGVDREPSAPKRTPLEQAQRRLDKAAAGTAGEIVWVVGNCTRCGQHFTRRRSGIGVQHCSKQCQARDKASRRRAREVGSAVGSVSRWRVHERDGWRCHICGDLVDRDAVVPDLAAPVLDHVVPLARGGPHAETNIKTAHFYCNSVKRDLVDDWSAVAA